MRLLFFGKNIWWHIGFILFLLVSLFFITMSLDFVNILGLIMQNIPSIFLILVLILSFQFPKVASIVGFLTSIGLTFLFGFQDIVPLLLTVLPVLVGSFCLWLSTLQPA